MSQNFEKTPLSLTLNQFAQRKVLDGLNMLGKELPCEVVSVDGQIVTVSFDVSSPYTLPQITIPILGFEYIRYPIQPKDKGAVVAFDARIFNIAGLGGGTPDLSTPGNLACLAFVPISNTTWVAVNPNVLTMYGPGGVTLMDKGQTTFVNLTPGEISMTAGGHSVVINSTGVIIDGKIFLDHMHGGVQTGGGDTAGVV